jgi:Skp family chaperone for outer membrane proteins
MRRRSIPLALATSALLSIAAFAQATPQPPRPSPQPKAASETKVANEGGTGAQGRIAIINTGAFRVGIDELRVQLEALNKEFEKQTSELEGLQKQIEDLKNKVQTQSQAVQPSVRNGWIEQGTELEKALKRKSEDYQALFQKRLQVVVGPVWGKINQYLGQYSQQHNIILVLEREVAESSNLLVWMAPVSEITEDFIKEFNKANTSSAPAAPRK